MAATWNCVQLDTTKTVGSLSDVITTVHWTLSETETVSGVDHTGYCYGAVTLADADSSSFTPYASVTKDNAISWAKAALGSDEVTRLETAVAAQITESKTPTVSSGVPW